MILTDKDIRSMCDSKDNPLISNFKEDRLQSASYDISISNKLVRFKKDFKTLDLVQTDIDGIYETITMLSTGYVLSPNEYVLVIINEELNLPSNLIARVMPRTRFTRMGLIVSSQHCNPTYKGRLHLGIYNATPYAIRIVPNLVLGQLVFEELKQEPTKDKLYCNKKDAAYNNETDFRGTKINPNLEKKYKEIIEDLSRGK